MATVRKDLTSEELKQRLETLSSDIKLREGEFYKTFVLKITMFVSGVVRAERVELLKHEEGEAEIQITIRCGWNRVVRYSRSCTFHAETYPFKS